MRRIRAVVAAPAAGAEPEGSSVRAGDIKAAVTQIGSAYRGLPSTARGA